VNVKNVLFPPLEHHHHLSTSPEMVSRQQNVASGQKHPPWKNYKAAECLHTVSELESDTEEARSVGL